MNRPSSGRLAVIGLDGIDLDFLTWPIEDGHMPTLAKLIKDGVSGPLTSTVHPVSAPAWESFKTGKNPGKHGVYDFKERRPDGYDRRLSLRQHTQTLWRLVSDAGLRVGVINVPRTYPPREVNGYLVSGMLTPPKARDFTFPANLCDELEQVVGRYQIEPDVRYRDHSAQQYLDALRGLLQSDILAALHLFDRYPSDLFIKVFTFTDRLLHHTWKYIDPNSLKYDHAFRDRVVQLFELLDTFLAEICCRLGDDSSLIIMSDHGFGPVDRIMYVNNWLVQQGYIRFKQSPRSQFRVRLHRAGINVQSLYGLMKKTSLDRLLTLVPPSLQEAGAKAASPSFDDIDWQESVAYSFGNFGRIFVNLRGREAKGCVEPGEEYEAVRDQIIADLRKLRLDGEPVVTRLWKCEELYHGPFLEEAPDILFTLKDWEYATAPNYEFASSEIFSAPLDEISANHRLDGMFIAWGKDIRPGGPAPNAHIIDMAPTILHIMGLPIPSDMDGQVLLQVFEPGSETRMRDLQRSNTGMEEESSTSLSCEDEQTILERLEGLGYA